MTARQEDIISNGYVQVPTFTRHINHAGAKGEFRILLKPFDRIPRVKEYIVFTEVSDGVRWYPLEDNLGFGESLKTYQPKKNMAAYYRMASYLAGFQGRALERTEQGTFRLKPE